VGIYNAELDVTLLYLHCEKISVRRGDVVEAGQAFAVEGDKGFRAYIAWDQNKGIEGRE